jgi:hypothetical protein
VASRANSSALKAAMPPETPSSSRAKGLTYLYWYLIFPAATSSRAIVR